MTRRLCTICVRGGSKGVPKKNSRLLNGKPLIAYSIEQAAKSGYFSDIAVSSDSEELLTLAKAAGATILVERPAEMATDVAPKIPVIRHCYLSAEKSSGRTYSVVCDLDATSPLRWVQDIKDAVDLLETKNASNVITGMPARRSPYFNLVEAFPDGTISVSKKLEKPIIRRQDAPKCWDMNASIYVWKSEVLRNSDALFQPGTMLHEMPEERSIDIDTELDFKIVNFIMTERLGSEEAYF
jgi:N-acylneuraminate cytidylyltransferase/CMP-N,N'-diacetyllegionaminic acid synthase